MAEVKSKIFTKGNSLITLIKRKLIGTSFAISVRWLRHFLVRLFYRRPFYLASPMKDIKHTMLSHSTNAIFFGYHDKTPFSKDCSKILAMSVAASDSRVESECTSIEIGYFEKNGGETFENRFIPVAITTTWCWQQGCMLQWYPKDPDKEIIFNALVDGHYGSIVYNVLKRKPVRKYKYPIYSLDPTGKHAATLNFSRSARLRPGYGYRLMPDPTLNAAAPENDGLFIFGLESGEKTLIVNLAALAREAGDPDSQHYVNHATFSSDGKRIVFFHLWTKENDRGRGLRVCEVNSATGEWRELESERTVSHYCWKDENSFLATTREKTGKWHYTLYDLAERTRVDLDLPFNEDGHPMFNPLDKGIMATDSYADKRRDQHLCLVDLNTKEPKEIATLYSPFRYRGQVRCDLHPRWDRSGKQICFDSTHDGRRAIYVIDLTDRI